MKRLIGSLYRTRTGRWSWKVVLPNDPEQKRRSIPLKPLGAKYATKDKKVAEECAKRILQEHIDTTTPQEKEVKTVFDLCVLYRNHIKEYYGKSSEVKNVGYAIAYLEKYCPQLVADDFDSIRLMKIREAMIDDGSCRSTINRRVSMIKRMFKWAVAHRHCSPVVFNLLETVEGLKRGRTKARETEKIKPVAKKDLDAVIPHLSDVIASMVQLQLVTGMRSTELCLMRPCDIDRSEDVWVYHPSVFKGQHREGYARTIALGRQAQDILTPYLLNKKKTSVEYLFKPEDGDQSQKHREYNPHYTKDSYGLAIRRKIRILNKSIKNDCTNDAEYESRMIKPWTPHRLRHTFASMVRKQEGTETARASLGHTKLQTLDVYAERDMELAITYARKHG